MPLIDNFIANLRAAKEKDEISWRQIGLRAKPPVHPVTISRILAGDMTPTLELCERLAKAAGIRADTAFIEPASTEPKKIRQPA